MNLRLLPYHLTWTEVDPATHPFDSDEVLDVVRGLEPPGRAPVRPEWRLLKDRDEAYAEFRKVCDWSHTVGWEWVDDMTRALVDTYGTWASGWRWSHDEGDLGGGPVGSWCCALHSITTPDETLDRVTAALREWRDWLEFLGRFFDRYPLSQLSAEDRLDAWERATHQLILHSLDRTGSGDAWYAHCRQVLTWFLTRWDVDPATALTLVEDAIGGRFESWTAPENTLVTDVAEHLAASIEPDAEPPADPGAHRYTSARLHFYEDERRAFGR
ncbi:hypothetical protein BN159_6037 [Streptomyces davaonensis JCM 4913]|uniref:Uncharacterized protein n=1 Tax=Streptomyces davaonensis (strain DSM 101723 / JCM 4913 / KCC S-0913 / 768) TaxID=1214101 RepID=K4R2C4_STRDJ|nr:hypothetical protein [Streptomyces davaonensis]CCK30416.1 hypothetical protein BN159_6037 [Streptomyces davaonensis JCM 4913]